MSVCHDLAQACVFVLVSVCCDSTSLGVPAGVNVRLGIPVGVNVSRHSPNLDIPAGVNVL